MKISDAIFGILLMALGLLVLSIVQGYPKIPGQQVGPALFPGLIAVGLCVGGLVLMVRGWRQRQDAPWFEVGDWVRSPRHAAGFAALVAAIIFYMLASQFLGFLISSTLILTSLFLILQVSFKRSVVTAVIVSLVIHFMFYKLLRVPLPWGVMQGVAW